MDDKPIHSPIELDESGWRGRVLGVTRIGSKAGYVAALALAGLFGLIVYGISTAGHRHPSNASAVGVVTKASEHQTPWWNAVPNGQPTSPALPPSVPVLPRVPLSPNERVPAISASENSPAAVVQAQALAVVHKREEQRRALLDAATTASVSVRLNEDEPSMLASARVPLNAVTPASPVPAATAGHDRLFATRSDDPAPYALHAGSVIPATLLTGINAELPGTIVGQVRSDVFDSVSGHYVLIPRGTRLVGTYDSRVVQGQHRVMVAWTRLLYPDGSSVDLPSMGGTDPAGYAGFGAHVDEHLNKVFDAALLLSIISAGAQLSQPQQSVGLYGVPSLGQTVAGAVGQQIGNTSIQLTQRQLQIPPTVEVPPGYLFDVLVDRDIVFAAPYVDPGAR